MTAYRFVEREKANHPVATMCRVLEVSPSGFWAWSKRPPSRRALADAALTERIRDIHERSRGTYGMPNPCRAAGRRHPLLAQARGPAHARGRPGGCPSPTSTRTTVQDRDTAPAPDLVERMFDASCPDALWVADITYLPTWQGFLYLAVVLDAFSRRVVGWSMAGHLRTELILDALDMAISMRRPGGGLIHHSDRGTQLGFKGSSQHCLVPASVGARRGPRPGSSRRGSCGAGC